MKKSLLLEVFAVLLLIFPVQSLAQPCSSLAELQWLTGDWIAENDRTLTRETWRQVSPGTFEGRGDTVVKSEPQRQNTESLRLVEMSGEVFYIAKVGHNALPTAFKLVECTGEAFVFENKSHDFPKRLTYQPAGKDSFTVFVSDGESNGFTLHFARAGDG